MDCSKPEIPEDKKTKEESYKTFCPACILVGIPLVMGLKALKKRKEKAQSKNAT